MAAILVHERQRMREIEAETTKLRLIRHDINTAHRHITKLATLGESVMAWDSTEYAEYHRERMVTDTLLETLKRQCSVYVLPEQIDTLRNLLGEKEVQLYCIMRTVGKQEKTDSMLVNQLPEVARRATYIRTITQKKDGIAGVFGGKKTVQILPSAKELYAFSDSLRIRNKALNRVEKPNKFAPFGQKELTLLATI